MAQAGYPRTIDNGHGQRITFLGVRTVNGVEHLEVENEVAPGHGPPMHVHFQQSERLTVQTGTLAWCSRDGQVRHVRQGETVEFLAGVPHRFWNSGTDVLRCAGSITPPLGAEGMLTALYQSAARNGGRPALADVARTLHRYRHEADVLAVPVLLKKLLFPLLRALHRS